MNLISAKKLQNGDEVMVRTAHNFWTPGKVINSPRTEIVNGEKVLFFEIITIEKNVYNNNIPHRDLR